MAQQIGTMAQEFHHDPFSYNEEQGNDDMDSLFGGDDGELSSLFTEVTTVAVAPEPCPSQEPDCETASPPSQERPQGAANPAAQLHFPKPEVQAQQSSRRTPSVAQLSLPAVPDPLGASLSHRDGHTSGDLVVSTQDSNHSTLVFAPTTSSVEEPLDDGGLEAELQRLWESITNQDQPVNAHTVSQERDAIQDDDVIPVTRIPGFRYAKSNSWANSPHRLPRRIDHDLTQAEGLLHCVTLNRRTTYEVLYSWLEMNTAEGKRLSTQMKVLLKAPPLNQFAEQIISNGVLDTKRTIIRIAFFMLVTEGWGATWFGDGCETAKTRTLFWPTDSSILLVSSSLLLYRLLENEKQARRSSLRAHALSQNPNSFSTQSPSPSRSLSIQLTSAPGSPERTTETQIFFDSVVLNVTAAKKRKHAASALGITSSQTPAIELEVPANARLTYHVYVKDKTDGSDLGPPATYKHTDSFIAHGAFSCIRSSFEAAGHTPILEIQTPFGRKSIGSEQDWEAAVLNIYNVRRSGGVVEVDVFV